MNSSGQLNWQRLVPFVAVLCFGLSYVAQLQYDTVVRYGQPKFTASLNEFIEPQPLSPAATRAASFGNNEFAADLYWLKLIQYYGGGEPNGRYRKLAELYNTVTDLSPKFAAAYQSGLLILPGEGFVDEAIRLGEKGQRNLPDSWEMPYYTGLVYHIYKKDYIQAAEHFTAAADLPNAPAIARFFAALYYKEADQRKLAYQIFQTIYDTTSDEYIKDRAQKYMGHLSGIFQLEDAIASFRQSFGRLPNNLQELVEKKVIVSLPESPLGFTYTYNAETGKVNEGK